MPRLAFPGTFWTFQSDPPGGETVWLTFQRREALVRWGGSHGTVLRNRLDVAKANMNRQWAMR